MAVLGLVSIHAPAQGATVTAGQMHTRRDVSIHAPAQGATQRLPKSSALIHRFNPRARAGRDNKLAHLSRIGKTFQSTRPRRARHIEPSMSLLVWLVSIHAPAQGATEKAEELHNFILVSIHAPAQGATQPAVQPVRGDVGFNPRARAGRDTMGKAIKKQVWVFQSTRPRRARLRWICKAWPSTRSFNPRARAGRDVPSSRSDWWYWCFNPRARAGRDLRRALTKSLMEGFQSTRPRRARLYQFAIFAILLTFQSTRPRRARLPRFLQNRVGDGVSIHAPAQGATSRSCPRPFPPSSFNPRARAGRDGSATGCLICYASFNPRARAGRDVGFGRPFEARYLQFQSTRPRRARQFTKKLADCQ